MYSFVCGSRKQNPWKKDYLWGDFRIYPTAEDEKSLLKCIDIRLGEDMLSKTKFNTTTQKSEAFNRALSRGNPKNVTFKRNFPGRIHSIAHLVNSGIADSTKVMCAGVGAPITTGSRVDSQLQQGAKREKYIRQKMRSSTYKTRRRQNRKKRFQTYFTKMEEIQYKKDLLLEPQGWEDHSYAVKVGEYPTTSGMQTRSKGRKIGKWTRKK